MTKLFSAAILLVSLEISSACFAQEFTHDVQLGYHDLDVSRKANVKLLDRRLRRAIAQVCPEQGVLSLGAKVAVWRCREAKRTEVATQRERALTAAQRTITATALPLRSPR